MRATIAACTALLLLASQASAQSYGEGQSGEAYGPGGPYSYNSEPLGDGQWLIQRQGEGGADAVISNGPNPESVAPPPWSDDDSDLQPGSVPSDNPPGDDDSEN